MDSDELRVGMDERDAATAVLGEHYAKGRLELDEFEHRVAAAVRARTRGDLRPLFDDLPPPYPVFLRTPDRLDTVAAGRLPEELRSRLVAEGVLLLAENLRGRITRRRYRAPREYSNLSVERVTGTVAVTGRRLLVWAGGAKRVDLTFDHHLRDAVELSVDKPNRLCIAVDAGAFSPDRSGRVEFRFNTPLAAQVVALFAANR